MSLHAIVFTESAVTKISHHIQYQQGKTASIYGKLIVSPTV